MVWSEEYASRLVMKDQGNVRKWSKGPFWGLDKTAYSIYKESTELLL